jgi:protein-tyrosine-phosphatase
MAHILVVCTANICRSPVVAALLRDRINKRGLKDWTVSSAGTWAQLRRGAADNSIRVMAEYGLDISDHKARIIEEKHLSEADLVLCMELGHVEALKVEFPDQAGKVFLLTEMSGHPYSVHDPYGEPLLAFQKMAAELAGLVDSGLDKIIRIAEENSKRYKKPTNLQ